MGDDSEDEHFYPQPARLAYREFFNLLLTCLKGHEDQRDVLLISLHKQLVHFVRGIQDIRGLNTSDVSYFLLSHFLFCTFFSITFFMILSNFPEKHKIHKLFCTP